MALLPGLHPQHSPPLDPPDDEKRQSSRENEEHRYLEAVALAQRDDHGRVIRVPRRAAEVVEDWGRDGSVEVVHPAIPPRASQDLELGAVGLESVDCPARAWSVMDVPCCLGGSARKTHEA